MMLRAQGKRRSVSSTVAVATGLVTVGLTARRSPRYRHGLSLIEVLLAMTIFLLAIVAIGRLVDMGTDRELEARLNTRGSRLAAAKLAEVESGATALTETGGTFDNDPEWTWTMTAEPQGIPNLYLVTVNVCRDLKGRKFEINLAQMMIDPAAAGAAAAAARPSDTGSDTTSTPASGTTTGSSSTPSSGTSGGKSP
jgi:prepilin-type N-terminal cleavage/methylation domain-containing protein